MPPLGGMATTYSMSSNCQAFALGHSSGSIHLFSKGDNETFNDFSEQTLIVDPPTLNNPYIDINNEIASFSSVPVPLTDQNLLSDWPLTTTPKFRPTPVINPEIMENSRVHMGIVSVPNRIDFKRNQINDAAYQAYTDELESLASRTAFSLREFDVSIEKLNGTERNGRGESDSSGGAKVENGLAEN